MTENYIVQHSIKAGFDWMLVNQYEHPILYGDDWSAINEIADLVNGGLSNQGLTEQLTDIRDIARSGLPSSSLTVEQSQQLKLNDIAGRLTRLIESLK